MINKLIYIKNCGKFTNFIPGKTSPWNGEFNKVNVIYGENGSGKTTLGQIFSSLTEIYDIEQLFPKRIKGKSINIKLISDDQEYVFNKDKWTNNNNYIIVYNIYYIRTILSHIRDAYFVAKAFDLHKEIRNIDPSFPTLDFNNPTELFSEIEIKDKLEDEALTNWTDYCKNLQLTGRHIKLPQGEDHISLINKYLGILNSDVTIVDYISHESNLDIYKLKVNDTIYDYKDTNQVIEYIMSEGQRNSLVFAYFLATMDYYKEKLKDVVLVFDDPF